jgi:hypothetical protein
MGQDQKSWNDRFLSGIDGEDYHELAAVAQEARAGAAWWQALAEERQEIIVGLRQEVLWLRRMLEESQDRIPVISEATQEIGTDGDR